MINYNMNNFLKRIHLNSLIIYKKNNQYYVIDCFVYIFKGLFNFKFLIKNQRKVLFIEDQYINYILKKLRECNINYVVININYGYDKILEYKCHDNKYKDYYQKGKNLIKCENKVNYIIYKLKESKDINLLRKVENVVLNG